MRAVWTAPGITGLQGANNALLVRQMNTLKRELTKQNDQLLIKHQDEDIIDGGQASTIQFHYLLNANTEPAFADTPMASPTGPTGPTPGLSSFDCNGGATGTAEYVFDRRRDLLKRSNLRNF